MNDRIRIKKLRCSGTQMVTIVQFIMTGYRAEIYTYMITLTTVLPGANNSCKEFYCLCSFPFVCFRMYMCNVPYTKFIHVYIQATIHSYSFTVSRAHSCIYATCICASVLCTNKYITNRSYSNPLTCSSTSRSQRKKAFVFSSTGQVGSRERRVGDSSKVIGN